MFHIFAKIIGHHHFQLFPTAYGYYLLFFSPPKNPKKLLQRLKKEVNEFQYKIYDQNPSFAIQAIEKSWEEERLMKLLEEKAPKQFPSISGMVEAYNSKKSSYIQAKLSEDLHALGIKMQKKGQKEEAKSFFVFSILIDPKNIKAHLHLGEYFHQLSPKDERQEFHFKQILQYEPKNTKALYFLGKLYVQWGNWEDAKELWEQFISLQPEDLRGYTYLGMALYELGDLKGAKEALLQALRLDPNYRPLYIPLARCYIKEKNFERARVMLRLLIERDHKSSEAHFLLSQCYIMLRQMKKAKKSLKRALKFNPDHMEAYRLLGELYMKLGDQRKGRKIQIKYKAWKEIVDKYGALKVVEDEPLPDFEFSSGDWGIEEIKIEDSFIEEDDDDEYY